MRYACIDIGSNTTRLLVAECGGGELRELHQERAFTRVARGLGAGGVIAPGKLAEVAGVVADQLRRARELGASEVHGFATAAVRRAGNGAELLTAIRDACGLEVRILSGAEEARLAFLGVSGTLETQPDGELGVVDVGGGSSELVVGVAPDRVSWSNSFALGSGDLADEFLRSDPPSTHELELARRRVAEVLDGLVVPHPPSAVAVGGSATSLRTLAGGVLDEAAFKRTLSVLTSARAAEVARRFALDQERVRLLPAGLLILQKASELFGAALEIGRGGIREGVLLEVSG